MARFEVYRIAGINERHLLDVQSHFLSYLESRVVVPLLPQAKVKNLVSELNPAVNVLDQRFVVIAQELTAVPARQLTKPVCLLAREYWDEITRALDILLTGF